MARIARTAAVALVLAACSFPASANAASGHGAVRTCSKVTTAKGTTGRPIARIAPNRSTFCHREKGGNRSVPLARPAI
jgi:hypothetical protein